MWYTIFRNFLVQKGAMSRNMVVKKVHNVGDFGCEKRCTGTMFMNFMIDPSIQIDFDVLV